MNKISREELQVNELSPQTKASLKSRIIVATILILALAPCLALGSWTFFVALALFLVLAIYELIKAPRKKYRWWVWVLTYFIVFGYVYWFVIKANFFEYLKDRDSFVFSLENYYGSLNISTTAIVASLFVYFIIAILDKTFDFSDVAYFFTVTILVGLGFQSFFFLRYYPFFAFSRSETLFYNGTLGTTLIGYSNFKYAWSCSLILLVILSATANDTMAYFGGIFFGKHKMNPRISPHKTWEGFAWGIIASFIVNLVVGFTLAATGYPILPTLDLDHWYWILFLSLALPIMADVGDLAFSLIKRHTGIKDFGSILPGHGGILDRIDSDMFTAIGAAVILVLITNGWNFAI